MSVVGLTEHYRRAFNENQAWLLAEAAVQIEADLARREDFSRLTAVVDRLALAQERTEQELQKLAIGHRGSTDTGITGCSPRITNSGPPSGQQWRECH